MVFKYVKPNVIQRHTKTVRYPLIVPKTVVKTVVHVAVPKHLRLPRVVPHYVRVTRPSHWPDADAEVALSSAAATRRMFGRLEANRLRYGETKGRASLDTGHLGSIRRDAHGIVGANVGRSARDLARAGLVAHVVQAASFDPQGMGYREILHKAGYSSPSFHDQEVPF